MTKLHLHRHQRRKKIKKDELPLETNRHQRRKKIKKDELPLEIIQLDILPRLPSKSVFRFKCVCKQWQSFLSTDEFATLHRKQMTKSQTRHKFLVVDRPPWRTFPSLDCKARKNGGLATFRPFPIDSYLGMSLITSLDGLVIVCVNIGSKTPQLVIWNPLTGDYRKLLDSKYLGFYCDDYYVIGLYIDSSFDYKLLHINFKGAYIYSLRMDSWRKIEPLENSPKWRIPSHATLFGESLYFTTSNRLISFDVKLEKFKEIHYPYFREGARSFCGSLVVIKGYLHLCVSYEVDGNFLAPSAEFELWQMNDDGWIKVVSAFPDKQQSPLRWTPICVLATGEWVMFWEHDNEDTTQFTREQLCLYSATSLLRGVVYNESQVSLNI